MVIFTAQHIAEFRAHFVTPYNGGTEITAGYSMPAYKDLMIVPDDGYKIDQFYAQRNANQRYTFKKMSSGAYATLGYAELANIEVGQNPTFTGYMIEPPKTYFPQKIVDEFAAHPVTVTVDGVPLSTAVEIKPDMVMVITANAGYAINQAYFFKRGGVLTNFNVELDLKSASYSDFNGFEPSDTAQNFYLQVDIVTPDVLNVNDVYLIDDDTAREITKLTFTYDNGLIVRDYSYALLGLIQLPFLFNETDVFAEQTIKLGMFDTNLPALLMNFDKYNYSLGEITTPAIKDNLLDFANTVCILHLPYMKSVVVDVDYVIGQTIYIDYLINLYDGTAVVNIKSTKTNAVFYTNNVDLGLSIPFANTNTAPTRNRPYDIEMGGFNGLLKPYIEVMRGDMILENGFFTIPVSDESILSNQVGFVKVDEIELKTKATLSEKQMILNELTKGVIIK